MGSLGKILRLSASERWLLIETTLLLGAVRFSLWLLPYRTLRRALDWAARVGARARRQTTVDDVSLAVDRASRVVPEATCLSQALTAQVLLARDGHEADLRVGFARDEQGQLQGHAWLESEGKVVVGDGELLRYNVLPEMK